MPIPRIVHQFWLQGADDVPPAYAAEARRLREMNPGWLYRLWDGPAMRAACDRLGLADKYDSFPYLHQKVDLGRYAVLFIHGGLSVDMDVVALRPLDAIPGLGGGACLIVSDGPVGDTIETFFASSASHTHVFNNAMILAVPGCVYLRRLLRDILEAPVPAAFWTKHHQVQWTTGPFIFTTSVTMSRRLLRDDGLLVLPHKYFEPCLSHDPHCVVADDAILDHRHASSWLPAWMVASGRLYFALKPFWPALLLLLLLLLLRMAPAA